VEDGFYLYISSSSFLPSHLLKQDGTVREGHVKSVGSSWGPFSRLRNGFMEQRHREKRRKKKEAPKATKKFVRI